MSRLPRSIRTTRLELRLWTAGDEPSIAAAVSASLDHLRPFMPWASHEPVPASDRIELFRQWEKEWLDNGDAVYGIWLDGLVVGGCGLHHRRGPGVLEIGYWVHVGHVRQGIATEAAAGLTTIAFTMEGIGSVEIHHDRANVASEGVPRALGFTLMDRNIVPVLAPAESGVHLRWAVSKRDWPTPEALRSALGSAQPGV